jgi:hypothetical protein
LWAASKSSNELFDQVSKMLWPSCCYYTSYFPNSVRIEEIEEIEELKWALRPVKSYRPQILQVPRSSRKFPRSSRKFPRSSRKFCEVPRIAQVLQSFAKFCG